DQRGATRVCAPFSIHRFTSSSRNRHWRPTLIAGISPHSAQKQTVRADTPNHRATAAVDKRGSLRGAMLGKFIAFTAQAGYQNIDLAGPLSEERHKWHRGLIKKGRAISVSNSFYYVKRLAIPGCTRKVIKMQGLRGASRPFLRLRRLCADSRVSAL